jgi:predicted AlkP superfamily phosphohydrolase/phosphomutase
MTNKNKIRVLILGLDGATFKILDKYLQWKGSLGFFRNLIENGVSSNLKVFFPCLSPMEWACFSTGKSPADLGIFGLYDIKRMEFNYRFFNSYNLGNFFWEILGQHGIKVGIVNIPASFPPKKVNGFLITGLLTPPGRTYYYPPEICPLLKNYKIDFEMEGAFGVITKELSKEQKDKFLKELIQLVEIRKNTLLKILNYYNNDINFICINFKEIDSAQHIFWEELTKIFDIYKLVEKATIEIYKFFSPDIVILMSDHGFHQAARKYFYLNIWLEKRGYLKRKENLLDIIKWKLFNTFKNVASKYKVVRNLIPESLKRYSIKEFTLSSIDTAKSMAFCDYWGILINKEDDHFVKRLKEELINIVDPENGKKIFSNILLREDLYRGKYLDKFPKIILIPSEGYKILPHFGDKIIEKRFSNLHLTGEHYIDLNGIFTCYGYGIRKGVKLTNNVFINDIAPTILHIYNVPIPLDMNGRVIKEIFEEDSVFARRAIKKDDYGKLRIKHVVKDLKSKGVL